jgi:cytochrome c biogenesis protein CcdA/thiol-disulfide isomerase/thioredoxin
MFLLAVVGVLAGIVTSLSPCVLPVLPVVLAAGAARRHTESAPGEPAETGEQVRRSWRPYGVVAGLVLSFSVATLFGSLILTALHLPQDLLRDIGVAVLALIGFSLLWPRLGDLLERPFARLPRRQVDPNSNGVVLGLGLGLLFVPCAGPVLATIAVVGASQQVSAGALVLTAAFGIGVGLPLLVLARAGEAITRRTGVLRRHARSLRTVGGVLMIVVAVATGLNLTDGLQRDVPGYTTALQNVLTDPAANQLHNLAAGGSGTTGTGTTCSPGGTSLQDCGSAPELTGITGWLNTPGDAPLTLAGLRGKVVLVDFWTYSCINCQRTLPHLEAWDRAYRDAGLTIIGVHTPEFAFEHVPANVDAQTRALGVQYPIAIDDDYGTWNAYANEYWPADYLVDATGKIRYVSYGEGGYADTENLIRQLLTDPPDVPTLPPPTEVADTTPAQASTPETYLGYHYAPLHVSGTAPATGGSAAYRLPATLDPDTFALGGTWSADPEAVTAGPGAQLELNYQADKVFLVLGGQGSVSVQVTGRPARTVDVSGPPTLYPLVDGTGDKRTTVDLTMSPGVQAYDFTFG